MKIDDRINANADYLIIAKKPGNTDGYYHALSERSFLVHNIMNFLDNHRDIDKFDIVIYELRQVN